VSASFTLAEDPLLHLSQVAGLTAYVLLWLNACVGLGLKTYLPLPFLTRWRVTDLHQFTALLSLGGKASERNTPLPFLGEGGNLQLRMNVFNLFNNLNLTPFTFNTRSTVIQDPFFGTAGDKSALAGRVLELQARVTF